MAVDDVSAELDTPRDATADATRWRKVAPLIDELSNARGLHRVHEIADQIIAATQEPTP